MRDAVGVQELNRQGDLSEVAHHDGRLEGPSETSHFRHPSPERRDGVERSHDAYIPSHGVVVTEEITVDPSQAGMGERREELLLPRDLGEDVGVMVRVLRNSSRLDGEDLTVLLARIDFAAWLRGEGGYFFRA